ncbi:hypothetical protein THAOC_29420 [Thalassiosira oceanica]|uniref:Leucine-rich repeat domain-containing protein n=1 Tax=Thalassiosira oceanica TaxID=159749 RepID=K0RCE3_THAOC|nr:hypothetical protein THAOC_29420 [Thalassiosira oceanica]|eukprot:EJK51408.1 hypothetical protein THAOC_29420 [Thalassiosira oceanica]
MDGNASGDKRERAPKQLGDEVFLYEGGEISRELRSEITRVRIGPQVKYIPGGTFQSCCNLAEVQFDEGALQVIGDYAFCGCNALQEVTIPPSVIMLGRCAFASCSNLANVLLAVGLQIIENSAFSQCSSLQQVTIPTSVTELGIGAFRGCINLAEVQFDEGALQVIGVDAFNGCKAMQQVAIPSSVTQVGKRAFRYCIKLAEVQFDEGVLEVIGDMHLKDAKRNLANVLLAVGLQIIENSAFSQCSSLQQVAIPSSVTELGTGAFKGCINLAEVQFVEGALQVIGVDAFNGCKAMHQVAIPSNVTKVGKRAFWDCTNLAKVILLGGERLLNRGFLDRGLSGDEGALNIGMLKKLNNVNTFRDCPLTTVKISIPRALSERMARLPLKCKLSIEGRIRELDRLELAQDGTVLACFPVRRLLGGMDFKDADNQTAESLHQLLRLISFRELKDSSILIELAMWKSRFDEDRARADCRISIPDPAKSLIMEYSGFMDFLEPAIEGA